jgi:hypothetical protein
MEEDQERLDELRWAEGQAAQLLDGGLSAQGGEVNAMNAAKATHSSAAPSRLRWVSMDWRWGGE